MDIPTQVENSPFLCLSVLVRPLKHWVMPTTLLRADVLYSGY